MLFLVLCIVGLVIVLVYKPRSRNDGMEQGDEAGGLGEQGD